MRLSCIALVVAALASAACHPRPVVGGGPTGPVAGTIAGTVTTDGNVPLPGRRVSAVETTSGARFDVTTGSNGGYTMKVPEGTYRLEIELRPGEKVAKQPEDTRINRSDLDPQRDFVITTGRGGA
jgi:hypothetical protein